MGSYTVIISRYVTNEMKFHGGALKEGYLCLATSVQKAWNSVFLFAISGLLSAFGDASKYVRAALWVFATMQLPRAAISLIQCSFLIIGAPAMYFFALSSLITSILFAPLALVRILD